MVVTPSCGTAEGQPDAAVDDNKALSNVADGGGGGGAEPSSLSTVSPRLIQSSSIIPDARGGEASVEEDPPYRRPSDRAVGGTSAAVVYGVHHASPFAAIKEEGWSTAPEDIEGGHRERAAAEGSGRRTERTAQQEEEGDGIAQSTVRGGEVFGPRPPRPGQAQGEGAGGHHDGEEDRPLLGERGRPSSSEEGRPLLQHGVTKSTSMPPPPTGTSARLNEGHSSDDGKAKAPRNEASSSNISRGRAYGGGSLTKPPRGNGGVPAAATDSKLPGSGAMSRAFVGISDSLSQVSTPSEPIL